MPRAAELSPIAQHQHNRQASEQAMLGQQAVKAAERQAGRKTKTESASKSDIKDRDPNGQGRGHERRKNGSANGDSPAADTPVPSVHPFKGKHIDFSG